MIFARPVLRKVEAAPGGQIVLDTFTASDGTKLINHTPDIDLVGGGWIDIDDVHTIRANKARWDSTSTSRYVAYIETNVSDGIIQLSEIYNRRTQTISSHMICRLSDADNYIEAGVRSIGSNPWTWGVWEVINGARQTGMVHNGLTTGNTTSRPSIKLTLSGTSVRCEIPEENIDTTLITSFNLTATKHGIRSYNREPTSSSIFDDFEVVA